MADIMVRIEVPVGPAGFADAGEADTLARRLTDELSDLDVFRIPVEGGPAPANAKGGNAGALSSLLFAVADPTVFSAALETVKAWLARLPKRTARLEIDGDVIDLAGLSAHDQNRLIDVFIERHTPNTGH